MKHLLVLVLACLSLVLAQCPPSLAADELMDLKFRRYIFERVWETVETEYIYEDFNGLDWQATHERYLNAITQLTTNQAFYLVLDAMILELGDDHSIYYSPWDTCAENAYYASAGDLDYLPSAARLESQPEVLYISLPSFDSPEVPLLLEQDLRQALRDGEIAGLILDLRHNYGGLLDAAFSVLGQFVSGKLGIQYDKTGYYPVIEQPGSLSRQLQNIPIIVFVDDHTHSAAEIVAGVLQSERQATIIGSTSAGNTEMLLPFDFIDGSRLWLAIGGFRLRDGTNLEGRGVLPDIKVDVQATTEDGFIMAALEALGLASPPSASLKPVLP